MRTRWSGTFTAWLAGGIIGVLEAIRLQNPISAFSVVSDRSFYFLAFCSYGLVALVLFAALRLFWTTPLPKFVTRVLIPAGLPILLLSTLYAFVPAYRMIGRKDAPSNGPNFILITLDTTRADHLGCYGYKHPTSPFLDSLAARGTLYTDAYTTATWTLPAHVSLFTGLMPTAHGVGYSNFFVSPSLHTLAGLMRQTHYTTAGFIGGPFLVSAFNIHQGFEYYDEQLDPHSKLKQLLLFRTGSALLKRSLWATDGQRRADEINREVFPYLDWLKGKGNFFLFINYFDPHEPYDPPESARQEMNIRTSMDGHIRHYFIDKQTGIARRRDGTPMSDDEFQQLQNLYDGEIRFMDDQIALLWRKLETNGLLENTIVVIAGDHGESIGEHRYLDHGHTLYQEQVHIPLLVVGPKPWNAGLRIGAPVQITDIFPTLLHATGIQPPEPVQGKDLRTTVDQDMPARTVFAELDADSHPRYKAFNRNLRMILEARNKLLEASPGQPELYNLIDDPAELNNIAESQSRSTAQLRQQIADHFRMLQAMHHQGKGEMDAETREKLKALGYIE